MAADFAPAHDDAVPGNLNGARNISPLSSELLKLEVNARTATDGAFSASRFNPTTRQLSIGVGEIFNLEVLYRDLRTLADRIGASAIHADLLYDSANASALEPVLTETQFLELSANVTDASTGTIDFTYPNTTSVVSVPFGDFAPNQAGSIQAAIQSLGYSKVSVQAFGRTSSDPFRYLIRYDDFALADQDLPNLIVTPRLDLTVSSTVTDEKPRNQDGSINSRAVPLNINFRSRTLPAGAGNTFFGVAGTQVGNFSAATGFTDVGGTGPLLTTGWPELNTGTPLPRPFDAFSIPVRMTRSVTDMRLVIDPPNTAETANRLYGRDEPIPSSQIIIDTVNIPAIAAGATGVIFITATSSGEAPTDIALNAASIAENNSPGAVIGTLSTVDPNTGDTFTYGLVTGDGGSDNASFTIEGNELKAASSFNFEIKNSYSVRVRSTDPGGLFTEKVFTITVTDVDEPLAIETILLPAAGDFRSGGGITVTVVLSQPVTVSGKPTLPIILDGRTRQAAHAGGSGTNLLTFTYTVGRKDNAEVVAIGEALVFKRSSSIVAAGVPLAATLPGAGSVMPGVRVDNRAPESGTVQPPANGTYRVGEVLRFTVGFSEPVFVSGSPQLTLTLARGVTRAVQYESGNGTSQLVFRYTVQAGDPLSAGGVRLGKAIAGGRIADLAGNQAQLRIQPPQTANVLVDGAPISPSAVAFALFG